MASPTILLPSPRPARPPASNRSLMAAVAGEAPAASGECCDRRRKRRQTTAINEKIPRTPTQCRGISRRLGPSALTCSPPAVTSLIYCNMRPTRMAATRMPSMNTKRRQSPLFAAGSTSGGPAGTPGLSSGKADMERLPKRERNAHATTRRTQGTERSGDAHNHPAGIINSRRREWTAFGGNQVWSLT